MRNICGFVVKRPLEALNRCGPYVDCAVSSGEGGCETGSVELVCLNVAGSFS